METSTAMAVINYNPTTKEQIDTFTDKLVGEVSNGSASALEVHLKLTALEKCFKSVKDRINSMTMDEVNLHPEKTFELFGNKIEKAELGVKYDFSNCGDPVLSELDSQIKDLTRLKKEREDMIKHIHGSLHVTVEETGEMVEIFAPLKTSTSGIKVFLK